jgi:hypothetical protein
MTAEALRFRRLGRILAMAGAQRRQCMLALAGALQAADDARLQLERVNALIADTGQVPGPGSAIGLTAGAQLRLLLQPAGEAAVTAAMRAAEARIVAEARLAEARARETRLEEMLTDARRAVETGRERRAAERAPSRSCP